MAAPDRAGLRILHIAESARGGVGTYLNQTLPELAELLAAQAPGGAMRVLMPDQHRFMLTRVGDAAVHTYDRSGRGVVPLLRLMTASWREIRAFRPHVVHLHSSFAGLMVRPLLPLLRLFSGVPQTVVYSPHGWAFQITGSPLRQRLIALVERMLATVTDRIVTLSDAERRECIDLGFPARKLVRIYNGIRREPVPTVPAEWRDERLKVFFVGRFDRQKGLDTLIEAARRGGNRICVRCAGASVVDGGEGQIAAPDNVEFLGWLNEEQIEGQFAAADVVAVPSRWEGFGLVAAEAMRARLPVVASRVGGLPEVVEEGVTGRLVPPDDPDALLAALVTDDAVSRRRMAEAGHRRFLELFVAQQSAAGVWSLYADAVAELPARR